MLVELGLVEQRLKAVHEVLDGAPVVDVAQRFGVARQTVHVWLKNYATHGMAGLVDKSSRPESCPHQMSPVVEARIVELRRAHERWGPTLPGVASMATYSPWCGGDEALRLFEGVRPFLDAEYPDWESDNQSSSFFRWEKSRSAVKKLIARIESREETEQIMQGDDYPALSAESMHDAVWEAAKAQWRYENHAEAVDAVARAINSMLAQRTGRRDVSEADLVRQSFSDRPPEAGKPRLRFPEIENQQTRESVRRGVMDFGAGCFAAIRNPLAHLPDNEIDISEQEALEALAAFSWFARRVEAATLVEAD